MSSLDFDSYRSRLDTNLPLSDTLGLITTPQSLLSDIANGSSSVPPLDHIRAATLTARSRVFYRDDILYLHDRALPSPHSPELFARLQSVRAAVTSILRDSGSRVFAVEQTLTDMCFPRPLRRRWFSVDMGRGDAANSPYVVKVAEGTGAKGHPRVLPFPKHFPIKSGTNPYVVPETVFKVGAAYTATFAPSLFDIPHVLDASRQLTSDEIIKLILDGLLGLADPHAHGFGHFDFKLENLLCCRDPSDESYIYGALADWEGATNIPSYNAELIATSHFSFDVYFGFCPSLSDRIIPRDRDLFSVGMELLYFYRKQERMDLFMDSWLARKAKALNSGLKGDEINTYFLRLVHGFLMPCYSSSESEIPLPVQDIIIRLLDRYHYSQHDGPGATGEYANQLADALGFVKSSRFGDGVTSYEFTDQHERSKF